MACGSDSLQLSPMDMDMDKKRSAKGGAKRKSKFCTEDERLCKEKERRSANNQRER